MAIGEIFLGSFFQVLFDKLTSLGLEYAQREGVNTALHDEWKGMLETINVVLDDAEDKQLGGNRLVKLWLDDVRDLAYDMEDLLDEFAIKATQVKSGAESSASRDQKKRKFFSWGQDGSSGSNMNSWKFFSWGQDGSSGSNLNSCSFETKVQEINGRLENIVTRKARLTLRENATDISNHTNKRLPSTSLPETRFFGREKEEAELLELLIGEVGNSNAGLSIVPIVGMGGVGKTAMAQRLYNDPKMNSYFERKAWVCVSDVFDVLDITKTILQSITGLSCEGKDLNWLQVKLKDDLSGKKFLVVLDDVWNEKYGEWTSLLKPFEVGANGSKIIITTRNHPVVSITRASPYFLKELSIYNCTSLLAYHALEATNFERHLHLEIVGKKIAEKCRGLPLAAKILGGLLRNKENPDEWEAILNNRIWDVAPEKNDEVLPALKLSYVHLPSYLKRCFAYCAVFPKDYEFERDDLALLWIAEGFLGEEKEKEKEKGGILRLGRDCFDELVSRSFFQQSGVNTSKFLMHDLLNDLAKSIANTTCFTFGDSKVVSIEEKARYASFVSQMVTTESSRAYARMKVLRSLMLLNVQFTQNRERIFISGKVLHDLLTNLKYLRVLSLCHCDIIEVPNCVGDLKYLRYLNLSNTKIKRLPESISTLCKLQALILRNCWLLSMLPPNIANLVSLQFLDIRGTEGLEEMPLNIGNLRNLIILPKFVVGPEKGSRLMELKNLPHLQGDLLISELQKVEEVRDAIDANLFGKQDLSNLFLHWNGGFGDSRNTEREARVLHSLRPHTNIRNLTISYYGGESLPSWLNGPSYSKMVSLCLLSCRNVRLLPSLGQLPSLRELSLKDLRAIRMIGSEFYGTESPFPSLTILKFEGMSAWKEWSYYAGGQEERVPFPCLQHLVVRRCRELTGELPRQLDNLIKLEICSCLHLNDSTNVVCLPSLCELLIKDCNKEILRWFGNLTSLTILKIENLAELVYFDNGFMSYLVNLKELHIRSCGMLTYLWQDGDGTRNLTCLQSVVIESCPKFTSFMRGQGEIELPCDLERMELRGCTSLERLPSKLHTLRRLIIWSCPKIMGLTISLNDPSNNNAMLHLEYLQIYDCDSWTYFPFAKDRLATLKTLNIMNCKGVESLAKVIVVESLESLAIYNCMNLGSLPQCLRMLVHLTRLEISDCPALKDLPPLPLTLLSLSLFGCPKMKSIANSNIDSCNNLTFLEIRHCPALEMEDFPPLPISLLHLRLYSCPKIKSLEWHRLTSLQELQISDCENIECFPEGGLPPNLRSFDIWECNNMKQPVREWGLPMLTSLEKLVMDGSSMGGEGDKECFPSDEDNGDSWSLLFPSSLKFVSIGDMRNVERLSNGLRNDLSSLQDLWIGNCPKLRDLPEDGFPPSFQWLSIYRCEILKDRCSKHTGDYWPLIQEIPFFKIDGVRIH